MSAAPAVVVDEGARTWGPQPGPQTAFSASQADLAFFGGAAGGGKSFGLLYDAVKWVKAPRVRRYRAVLFRRKTGELTGGGGLWDESQEMYRAFGGWPRSAPTLDWTFEAESNAIEDQHRIELRHMQHEKDVHAHQGRQYAFVGFDEVTHFTPHQFWYMVSRLRSTCGVKPYLRATCNPDPDSFVYELIEWWIDADGFPIPERSGVLRWFVRRGDDLEWFDTEQEAWSAVSWTAQGPDGLLHFGTRQKAQEAAQDDAGPTPDVVPMSLTFIASRLADNPALTRADPAYRAKLLALGRVERERLLGDELRGGNWHTRAAAGIVFDQNDFVLTTAAPAPVISTVRFWDKAATVPTPKSPDPDWTRGVRVSLCEGGLLWIDDVVSLRDRGTAVLRAQRKAAVRDGVRVTVGLWQDTGGAGKTDVDVTTDALAGFAVQIVQSFSADTTGINDTHKSSKPKRVFADAWASWVERGRVYVLDGQPWTGVLLSEGHGFPDARHDDIIDAISGAFQVLVGQGFAFWDLVEQGSKRLG